MANFWEERETGERHRVRVQDAESRDGQRRALTRRGHCGREHTAGRQQQQQQTRSDSEQILRPTHRPSSAVRRPNGDRAARVTTCGPPPGAS